MVRTPSRGPQYTPTLTGTDPPTAIAFFWFLAAAIALAAAVIAIAFRILLATATTLFLVDIPQALLPLGATVATTIFLVLPALGGLLVGLLTLTFGQETRGHGVPDIIASLARTGGRLRSRWIPIKALASALCVGSGGSAGREGPIIYMSSTSGSALAQALHLPRYPRKVLVACAATAGMSAAFNTPLAAVLFSLELILREFKTQSFIPLVISSVFGTLLSRFLLATVGITNPFIFPPPTYTLVNNWELAFYLALGIICGILAVLFIRTMKTTENFFRNLKPVRRTLIPEFPSTAQIILKPAFGGLIVGAIGLLLIATAGAPYNFGIGYDVIHLALTYQLSLILIASLIFLKLISTCITIGSGGSGGVFSTLFFVGCMTGATFGGILHFLVPFPIAGFEAYAVVGMAAFFAGSTRATLTAILMVFEMTGNYLIILPLMFSCVIADGVSAWLSRDTIFTMNLAQRGVLIEHDFGVSRLKTRTAADVMRTTIPALNPNDVVTNACTAIQTHRSPAYPIQTTDGRFLGFAARDDLMDALIAEQRSQPLATLLRPPTTLISPTTPLDQVLDIMNHDNTNYLAVTPPDQPTTLLGVVTRNDILKAFEREPWEE